MSDDKEWAGWDTDDYIVELRRSEISSIQKSYFFLGVVISGILTASGVIAILAYIGHTIK